MPYIGNVKGEQGGSFIGGTTASFTPAAQKDYATGFTVITDTVLLTISSNYADVDDLVGVTLIAGMFVPGIITEVTPTSGLIQVHDGSSS